MPTYEYTCENCNHKFDIYQSMKEEKLQKCPNCGQNTLKRLIGTGGGLIFKGSGFYLTDYKNKSTESNSTTGTDKSNESSKPQTQTATPAESKSTKPETTTQDTKKNTEQKPKE